MQQSRHVDLHAISHQAMRKYGFEPAFPSPVMQEVGAIREQLPDPGSIRDLRSLPWSSIDNDDSMDLDQLEVCEPGTGGEIAVKIAIADVDRYVPKDSRTDRYASHNGTSVYTGVETYPMLPDRLSKGISSLLPGRDRVAVVIEYTVLPDGDVRPGDLYHALVSNKAQLVYEEVGDWLEGVAPVPGTVRDVPGLEQQIRLQYEAALRLKRHRFEHGALVLNTIEARPVMEADSVRELQVQRQNSARCLIEDFMVAANGVMINFLGKAGLAVVQRVVRVPKFWDEIVVTASQYGEKLPAAPDAKALSLFLARRKVADPERFPDLSLTIVKLLGPGEYLTLEPGGEPTGHFSLAVSDYTHATAPNRRFVDIINQRLLKSVLAGKASPYSSADLEDLAAWLTDRDMASKKVERFVRKAAAAVLLQDRIGESFEGLVTGASEKGTYVRLIDPPVEGRVVSGERGLRVGDKIRVRLQKTDPYNGFIDFERLGGGEKKVLPGSMDFARRRKGR
ncbi:MAG: RNB domain-containing ribonuclease [Methanoregulaceae archaeon]|nr:RNB domain-containing ribonuclease [Methanoregulaceae archaeon]